MFTPNVAGRSRSWLEIWMNWEKRIMETGQEEPKGEIIANERVSICAYVENAVFVFFAKN